MEYHVRDPKKGRKHEKKLVTVRCPCTGSNGGMDQIKASQKIVGEVASIGVPGMRTCVHV